MIRKQLVFHLDIETMAPKDTRTGVNLIKFTANLQVDSDE